MRAFVQLRADGSAMVLRVYVRHGQHAGDSFVRQVIAIMD